MNNSPPITVSLEMARRLKEAGFPEERLVLGVAEEILRELPEVLYLGENREAVYLSIMPDDDKWIVLYSPSFDQRRCDKENFWKRSKISLADACSEMYIYLKSNNLLHDG